MDQARLDDLFGELISAKKNKDEAELLVSLATKKAEEAIDRQGDVNRRIFEYAQGGLCSGDRIPFGAWLLEVEEFEEFEGEGFWIRAWKPTNAANIVRATQKIEEN